MTIVAGFYTERIEDQICCEMTARLNLPWRTLPACVIRQLLTSTGWIRTACPRKCSLIAERREKFWRENVRLAPQWTNHKLTCVKVKQCSCMSFTCSGGLHVHQVHARKSHPNLPTSICTVSKGLCVSIQTSGKISGIMNNNTETCCPQLWVTSAAPTQSTGKNSLRSQIYKQILHHGRLETTLSTILLSFILYSKGPRPTHLRYKCKRASQWGHKSCSFPNLPLQNWHGCFKLSDFFSWACAHCLPEKKTGHAKELISCGSPDETPGWNAKMLGEACNRKIPPVSKPFKKKQECILVFVNYTNSKKTSFKPSHRTLTIYVQTENNRLSFSWFWSLFTRKWHSQ